MLKEATATRFYRFIDYEVDSARRLLLRDGQRVALTPKAFDVLLVLLERHGETVSKDDLLRLVWPDTVVEEISLTRNISVLRKTLGETPDEHNFIVTVPGTGYRFVAPVEHADDPKAAPARNLRPWLAASALAAAVSLAVWYFWPAGTLPVRRAVPLTSYPGIERHPALSPDGNHVAFSWDGEKQDNSDIYVKTIGAGAPLRLTTNPAEDVSPAWSPDGRTVGSLRRLAATRNQLLLIPAWGGPERKLAETAGEFRTELPSLAWSPDGRWLAVSHREPVDLANALFLVSAQTGEKRRLTAAPRGFYGDYAPAFSPDARSLAFVRLSGYTAGAIYLLPLSDDSSVMGEPQRLTAGGRLVTSPVWTRDGHHIAYISAEAQASREVRLIAVSGARNAEPIPWIEGIVTGLSLGRHLVYALQAGDANIWRAEVRPPGVPLGVPVRLIASTRADHWPRYSPDGKKVVFASNRSGGWEIWTAEADGSSQRKLTSLRGPSFMSWSPDGRRIAFQSAPEGQTDVFTIPATGGAPARLTNDPSDDRVASFSRNGRWIYFSSMRSGRWEIWKAPAEGGDATQITHSEGSYLPLESPDGKTLYYCHKLPEKGIWKMPVEGGPGVQVTGPYSPPVCGLEVTADGLYYTPAPESPNQYSVAFFSFSTGKSRPVVITDRPIGILALSVSPDQRYILYSQSDQSGSDLMLVENFALR
jgi:Tol biopolymer transport system component/DNA-binding winged helix-turn-helix (wHTH) protein